MSEKLSIEILTPNRIWHMFHEYAFNNNIYSKIKKEVEKKVYIFAERKEEVYLNRLITEYFKWAKENDIPNDLKESCLEFYIRN